jgi:hypothetical protein
MSGTTKAVSAADLRQVLRDPEMQSVQDSWPTLPSTVKAEILAMIRATPMLGDLNGN